MALSNAQVKVEHREILLKERPKKLYEISSKATVPVLYINKDKIIDESLDIMLWVIQKWHCNWLNIEKEKQLDMININDSDFKYYLDRYKYYDRYPELSFKDYQKKCEKYLNEYNHILKDKLYFFGNQIQLVDVALFPFIRQCAHVDSSWFKEKFINLNKWLNAIKSSNIFLSVMHKYEIWNQNNPGIITIYK